MISSWFAHKYNTRRGDAKDLGVFTSFLTTEKPIAWGHIAEIIIVLNMILKNDVKNDLQRLYILLRN